MRCESLMWLVLENLEPGEMDVAQDTLDVCEKERLTPCSPIADLKSLHHSGEEDLSLHEGQKFACVSHLWLHIVGVVTGSTTFCS